MGIQEELDAFDREWAHDPTKQYTAAAAMATVEKTNLTPPANTTPPAEVFEGSQAKTNKRKKADTSEANKKAKVQENRAIYVSNLPLDATKTELEDEFKRFGIIDRGADGQPRITMYRNDEGNFKGEALIVYFKKESIMNAIRIMDDYVFRPGDHKNGTISVKEAEFSYKKEQDADVVRTKLSRDDRKATDAKNATLNSLTTWTGDELASEVTVETPAVVIAPKKNKWAKTVILKYMFDIEDLESPDEYNIVMDDIKSQATENGGTVIKVILFDQEPNGIATVRFQEFDEAEKFRDWAHFRPYGAYKVRATLADSKPNFRRSKTNATMPIEDISD